ncbi:Hypothetical predicted protein, partial [Mytilus galloprovincialis]
LVRKLRDKEFVQIVSEYDVLCLSECWVKCPDEFELDGYEKKYLARSKCGGGGVVLFYKKWLCQFIDVIKYEVDSMIWLKFDKRIMPNNKNLYMCVIYMPPDRNVYYKKYNIDVFDVLQEQIELFATLGTVSVIGDLNGRVGIEPDFIVEDTLDKHLLDTIDFISYVSDVKITDRLSEDLKAPNGFGRRILDICKSTGLRICNGRFGTESSKYTFQNKNGCSLIDYMLISQDNIFTFIKALTVKDFNMFSCHAPLSVELYLNVDTKINDQCTCIKSVLNRVKWNEGFKDGLVNDMLTNVQKFDDLMLNLTEHENDIDKCVGDLNNLLTEICEQYTKTEVEFTDYCEHCIDSNANKSRKSFVKIDKPWISEDCKNLYRQYK